MSIPTGRESDKFMLRLPDGMRDRIKSAAEISGRSMNAEIVHALAKEYPEASHGEFGQAVVRFMQHYREAETDEDKHVVLARMKKYVESDSPGLTAHIWLGMPTIISKKELEQIEARGPSFLKKLAEGMAKLTEPKQSKPADGPETKRLSTSTGD